MASGKKLFESDISHSLHFAPYFYKPQDGVFNANKTDFFVTYMGSIALEAKEVDGPTWNGKDLRPGQRMTLLSVAADPYGLALIAVNFMRKRRVGTGKGSAGLWVITSEASLAATRFPWTIEAADVPLRPVPRGWDLKPALDQAWLVALKRRRAISGGKPLFDSISGT